MGNRFPRFQSLVTFPPLVPMLAILLFAPALLTNAALPEATLDIGLPTANESLFTPEGGEKFFQATVSGTWESGRYGCVRTGKFGPKFHEGIDIQCLQRDRKGEPVHPVRSVADGTVVFINIHPGQSNYGLYLILRHEWNRVEVFTLYAHLREIVSGLAIHQHVSKGQVVAVLGRSTNTREGISRDRAHVHFEINFMMNPHFYRWYPTKDPKAPDFGNYNGQNFIGIDPAAFFLALRADPKLNFADYLRRQPEAFRVIVPARPFPWLAMHPEMVRPASGEVMAYEVVMNFAGLPLELIPRETIGSSTAHRQLPTLLAVNEGE